MTRRPEAAYSLDQEGQATLYTGRLAVTEHGRTVECEGRLVVEAGEDVRCTGHTEDGHHFAIGMMALPSTAVLDEGPFIAG